MTKKKRRVEIAKIERRATFKSPSPGAAKVFSARPKSSTPSSEPTYGIVVFSPVGKAFTPSGASNDAVLRRLVDHLDRSSGFRSGTVDVSNMEGEVLEECVRALEAARKTVLARAREAAAIDLFHPPRTRHSRRSCNILVKIPDSDLHFFYNNIIYYILKIIRQ